MTVPKQARRRSESGPRTYAWPPIPPHEFELISVTSAINAGLNKPFLTNWAAKLVAEKAVEDFDLIKLMLEKDDKEGAIAHLKGAPHRNRQAAADRGTLVHSALESYVDGKKFTDEELNEKMREGKVPTKLWAQTRKMYSGLIDFMFDAEPEIIWQEATVYSRTHGYAGTLDMLPRMVVGGAKLPVVLDVKSSKRIYDETALQLVAYARADFVGLDDGTEMPLLDTGERIDYGVVIRPKPSGGYEKVVFALTDDIFTMFLGCLAVANGKEALERARRPS